jgi:hypothetical protein
MFEIKRVEAFGEPAVDRREQIASLLRFPLPPHSRAMLIAARSSQDFASCARATERARSKELWACAVSRSGDIKAISPRSAIGLGLAPPFLRRFERRRSIIKATSLLTSPPGHD